jgi:hypothetical protein
MNLIAWVYARVELKKVENKFDEVKDELEEAKVNRHRMYEWQKSQAYKLKQYETNQKTDSQSETGSKQDD